jgi:hypothetical protein
MKKIALIIFISVFLSGYKSTNISLNFNEEKDDLYLFDAQSQFSQDIKIQEVLNIIKKSGVQRVILSTTQRQKNAIVYEIAKQNPERIIPGARLKIRSFYNGDMERLKKQLDGQLARWPKYSVITEALIYHTYFFLQNTSLYENKIFKTNQDTIKWTCVFCEKRGCSKGDLKPEWENLFISHPNRFIFAIDGVQSWIWRKRYEKIVREWKFAISKLPKHAGRKIAHENAESLWHIKPLY